MVEETIQVIRETEAKAGAIVKEADAKCRKILDDASKEADMAEGRSGRSDSQTGRIHDGSCERTRCTISERSSVCSGKRNQCT